MPQPFKQASDRLGCLIKPDKPCRIQKDANKSEIFGCEMLSLEEAASSRVLLPWLLYDLGQLKMKAAEYKEVMKGMVKESDLEKVE